MAEHRNQGMVTVIGLGPGRTDLLTARADAALRDCDCIVGYHVYTDLIRDSYPGKEILTTPMRREEERCRMALQEAASGKKVAFVCSGDPGVYGMAGLLLELSAEVPGTEIRIEPGITAALSGAALLGAPLIHDFAVISLSDLMTPWETIARRLRAAAEGDLGIVLYNPASKKRADYLQRAAEILLETLPADRVCGLARRIGREGENAELCSLGELGQREADMFTTVFIGSSTTTVIGGKMVTPRGYRYEKSTDLCGDN